MRSDLLKAHSQVNGMFLFSHCYILSNVWVSEGNIPIDYNFWSFEKKTIRHNVCHYVIAF